MTVEEIASHLRWAEKMVGDRFNFIIYSERPAYCVMRWYRPEPNAFEDNKILVEGTADECMAAVDRYVAEHATVPAMAAE